MGWPTYGHGHPADHDKVGRRLAGGQPSLELRAFVQPIDPFSLDLSIQRRGVGEVGSTVETGAYPASETIAAVLRLDGWTGL